MFLADGTLHPSYGYAGNYGAPALRVFPAYKKKIDEMTLQDCGRYAEIYARILELHGEWKGLKPLETAKAAQIEFEAKQLIKALEAEAVACNPATGGYTSTLGQLLGLTRTAPGAGGGRGMGAGLRPAGPRSGGGMAPTGGGAQMPVDAGAGAAPAGGMDTTTLLLLGGGALALFLFMRKGGKKSGGSTYAGRD